MRTAPPSSTDVRPLEETIAIGGMSCGHCVAAVRGALEAIPGVAVEHVAVGEARIRRDPGRADRAAVESAIEEAGFTPRP
jgi:copper chaperone CopZ